MLALVDSVTCAVYPSAGSLGSNESASHCHWKVCYTNADDCVIFETGNLMENLLHFVQDYISGNFYIEKIFITLCSL